MTTKSYYIRTSGGEDMSPEERIAQKVKDSGMTIRAVSVKTGVAYSHLQPSLKGVRELRADEYIKLCAFFGVDPFERKPT